MYNRCVESARQQADLLSWREGGGPEDSDHQLLGQSSQTLQAVSPLFYKFMRRSYQFYTMLFRHQ